MKRRLSGNQSLDPAVRGRLADYVELVRAWANRLDLVAPRDLPRFEERHLDDALRALPLLDEVPAGPCADVGSGAGIPGIPLAIGAPGRLWRLLEPRTRRAAFLEEVVRSLELECEVLPLTAEAAAADPALAGSHALVTARALAPPPAAGALCRPLVATGGAVLLWVGRDAALPEGSEELQPGLAIIRDGPERGSR